MSLKLGVSLPQTTNYDLTADVTESARAAEQIGFDSVWVFERLLMPEDQSGVHGLYGMPDVPWPGLYGIVSDALITLAMAAAVTDRIELGTGVLVPPLHLPVRLAKSLASLDASSGGRLIAGLGSGWSIDEFAAAAPRPIKERGAALDEFLDVAAAVWGPDPVVFDNGRFYVSPAQINPKPARRIPIYLGGSGQAALRRIARRADGWLPTAIPPAQTGATLAQIRELAAAEGRDPAEIRCVFQVFTGSFAEVPSTGRQPYTGSIAQVVEDIAALAEAGVDHVFVTVPFAVSDIKEWIDATAALHAAVREAGI